MKAEQDVRIELDKLSPSDKPLTPEDRQKPEVKTVLEWMEKVDRENLAWPKGAVDKHGWPGKSLVGAAGAQGRS